MQKLCQPVFDPEIIRRHLNADTIEAGMRDALARQERGERLDAWTAPISIDEMGTDEGMKAAVPFGDSDPVFRTAILGILVDLRDNGQLAKIPNVEGRGLESATSWNHFVETGQVTQYGYHSLTLCPIPKALRWGILSGGMDAIRNFRKEAGLDPYPGTYLTDRVGLKALMPMGDEHIRPIAEAAALEAVFFCSGQKPSFSTSDITCLKTGERLHWQDDQLLAPVLGHMIWGDRKLGTNTRFVPLEPWVEPRAIRHVEIAVPSGVVLMADWFRVPGFTEGIRDKNEFKRASINSDQGIDIRTRDHYERLGLMRIHTGNCVPQVIREGGLLRIGHLDEDHEDLWIEKEDGSVTENTAAMPEVAGRVCCDLWDVTFADREILIDIIVAGGKIIEANGGIGDRNRPVSDFVTDRVAAGTMLDAYVSEHDVATLKFEPGQTLHVYMATGHRLAAFPEVFESPDVAKHEWFEDMFVISDRKLTVDPTLLEEDRWARPDVIFDRTAEQFIEGPGL